VRGFNQKYFSSFQLPMFGALACGLSACLTPPNDGGTATNPRASQGTQVVAPVAPPIPAGARGVRVIFKSGPNGSFDVPPPNGTVNAAGSGLKAMRLFTPSGLDLASGGYASAAWPKWIKNVEIGISGTNNLAAQDPNCARFALPAEDTSAQCNFDGVTSRPCGASSGLFRISEYDCGRGTAATNTSIAGDGPGNDNDGIYLRVQFDRAAAMLAPSENIMAVLEYSAAAVNSAPVDPTTCFTGGRFAPQSAGCADMVWQIYMKHQASDLYQPYLMLVPPMFSYVNSAVGESGLGVGTKQFIVPLASDAPMNGSSGLTEIQLSRVKGLPISTPGFQTKCNGAAAAANSALCAGMVFYSLTLYRI